MQMQSTKLFALSLILLSILGGCKKNKQPKNSLNKSETSKISRKNRKSQSGQVVDPLDLDKDSMQTFALDDKITKHHTTPHNANHMTNPTLSWDDVDTEKSRNQFQALHFDFDKDNLKANEIPALKSNIETAKKMIKQGKTIVIEGHACHSAGSAAYNMAISERRARHVAEKFAEHNIDASHIKIAPRGQEMPVRKGGNKQEQWVNRRVEIYAIDSK